MWVPVHVVVSLIMASKLLVGSFAANNDASGPYAVPRGLERSACLLPRQRVVIREATNATVSVRNRNAWGGLFGMTFNGGKTTNFNEARTMAESMLMENHRQGILCLDDDPLLGEDAAGPKTKKLKNLKANRAATAVVAGNAAAATAATASAAVAPASTVQWQLQMAMQMQRQMQMQMMSMQMPMPMAMQMPMPMAMAPMMFPQNTPLAYGEVPAAAGDTSSSEDDDVSSEDDDVASEPEQVAASPALRKLASTRASSSVGESREDVNRLVGKKGAVLVGKKEAAPKQKQGQASVAIKLEPKRGRRQSQPEKVSMQSEPKKVNIAKHVNVKRESSSDEVEEVPIPFCTPPTMHSISSSDEEGNLWNGPTPRACRPSPLAFLSPRPLKKEDMGGLPQLTFLTCGLGPLAYKYMGEFTDEKVQGMAARIKTRYGLEQQIDLVLDSRCIRRNLSHAWHLIRHCGEHYDILKTTQSHDAFGEIVRHVKALALIARQHKCDQLTVVLVCKSGTHRGPACGRLLHEGFHRNGYKCTLRHLAEDTWATRKKCWWCDSCKLTNAWKEDLYDSVATVIRDM